MTTYSWPSERVLIPQTFSWGPAEVIGGTPSPYTGDEQTGEVPFSHRWVVTLGWPPATDFRVQHSRIGFLTKLRRSHRILIPHFGFVKNGFAPFGTLRAATVATTAAQGATSIALTPSSGATVLRGDVVALVTAIGTQVVMCTANTDTSAAALPFEPPLRAIVSSGSSVTCVAPAAKFRLDDGEWSAQFTPGEAQPIVVSFRETIL